MTMQRQFGDLAQVAFDPAVAARGAGPTKAQTKLDLDAARDAINASLATLARVGGTGEWLRIDTLGKRYVRATDHVAMLVALGSSRLAALEFGREEHPSGSYGALLAELRQASTNYDSSATHWRRVDSIGTAVAVAFMLIAFSFTLLRATRLAQEKHRLLTRSQTEALTDALTGLPNRRKLFVDMDMLLRESPRQDELAVGMFDLDGFKEYNDTFGHPAGDDLLARTGRNLAAAVDGRGTAYRIGGDEFCVIARGDDHEGTLAAAAQALSEHGKLFSVTCSRGSVTIAPGEMSLEQALQQADQRLYDSKRSSRAREGGEAHKVLLRVLSESSLSLATHLTNVGKLAEAVARKLGLSEDEVTLTRLAAELHDIGKTAIPSSILDKPGPLDSEEWAFMRRHTIIGERILAAAPALSAIAPLVRSSHERPDGAGYPDGLRAEEIPLSSRIVAVVDAYDAMASNRPYALPLTTVQAIEELRRCAGTQFDSAVVEAFVAVWQETLDGPARDVTVAAELAA